MVAFGLQAGNVSFELDLAIYVVEGQSENKATVREHILKDYCRLSKAKTAKQTDKYAETTRYEVRIEVRLSDEQRYS